MKKTALASAQIDKLLAVAMVFQILVNNSFNLHTDSHYVFKALHVIEIVLCIGSSYSQVRILFEQIQNAIHLRILPCFICDTGNILNKAFP